MDTSALKKFAQEARRSLRDQVTAKLDLALAASSAARREAPGGVDQLEKAVRATSRDSVVEKIAYTWFNRFSALRFMDANGLTGVGVLSSRQGETRPEILSEAMAGVIGSEVPAAAADKVRALLDGRAPSRDPQGEAYRLLVVAACNHWHGLMPFLFEPIADETELLMPDDLLSASSVPARLRAVMTDEACRDVEIIGWLYQFYISEKKDEVFAALKKNVKITPDNIPAATQLFTPHWIVRYLVENSLGRLWLLNRPQSRLAAQMDYYIAPVEPETDFLRVARPEEIRICDPACGSGHMLTYAFDLLHAIYEEEGHDAAVIPSLILTHNLHGIEIDDRAGALAAFALAMKAAAKLGRRKFLRMTGKPDICVLQNVRFSAAEMQDVAAVVGRDLFTGELRETLAQFEQAKNFGSLIVPKLRDPAEVVRFVRLKDFGGDLLLREVQERVLGVLRMAETLSRKYHVVVANPPYMSASGMNVALKNWLKMAFVNAKADLMTAFMDRSSLLAMANGYFGMINLPSWMFLGTYEKLRINLLDNNVLLSLLHLGRGIFGSDFGSVAFVFSHRHPNKNTTGVYRKLFENHVDVRDVDEIASIFQDRKYGRYNVAQDALLRIPGAPISYWISERVGEIFSEMPKMTECASVCAGHQTSENDTFLRQWTEVSRNNISTTTESRADAILSSIKWYPHNKGGEFRRWYGNRDLIINWQNDGAEIRNHPSSALRNPDMMFREGVTWSHTTSGSFGARFAPLGSTFNVEGPTLFHDRTKAMLGLISSRAALELIHAMGQTIHFLVGTVSAVPVIQDASTLQLAEKVVEALVTIGKSDWDAFETSWDFTRCPLIAPEHRAETLEGSYARLHAHWRGMTDEMRRLEEDNNRIFIDAYGLQAELTSEVPLTEITLTCNPAYRYGGGANEEALETRLRADTMREFLSYAIGCMFGRYSLNEPGLILANQGDTLETYLAKIPNPSFAPTADNVIPVLDSDWFADDVTERFHEFLRVTFGEAHFAENLAFIEEALGKDIRGYFTRDFFNDHVKRYKKRPIYWLFSSPQGTFSALIYMHRTTPDTVNVLLNEYLRPFRSKLEARRADQQRLAIDPAATAGQRTKADKEILGLEKAILEIDTWERDVVYPLASRRIEIDLDDGVKANYPKFAGALKPIKGLEEAED